MFTTRMSRSPHPGETHPPVPPTDPDLRRVRLPVVPRRAHRADPARYARLQHRAAPPVRHRPGRADARHRLGRPVRVRHRRELARGGVGRGRARLRDAGPAGRRVHRGVQAAVDRGRGHSHHGEFFSFDGAVFVPKPVQRPWPPILVGGESAAALRRAAKHGDGWIGMRHDVESGAARIATLKELLVAEGRDPERLPVLPRWERRDPRRREALGGRGVTRMVLSPWARSKEAIDGMRRFAETFLP